MYTGGFRSTRACVFVCILLGGRSISNWRIVFVCVGRKRAGLFGGGLGMERCGIQTMDVDAVCC